jgi:hypothetical protein
VALMMRIVAFLWRRLPRFVTFMCETCPSKGYCTKVGIKRLFVLVFGLFTLHS